MITVHHTRNWTTGALAALAFFALSTAPTLVNAQDVTESNVAERIAAAKTPQQHEAIAAFFRSQASAAGEEAKKHEAMVASWNKTVSGKALANMRRHCEDIITAEKKIQKDNEALAAEHEKMAKAAAGK